MTWAHHHGVACCSCPDLKEVLEDQCWGSTKAVWGCVDGHRYIMDTQSTAASYSDNTVNSSSGPLRSGNGDGVMSEEEEGQENEDDGEEEPSERTSVGSLSTLVQQSLSSDGVKIQKVQDEWTGSSEGKTTENIKSAVENTTFS